MATKNDEGMKICLLVFSWALILSNSCTQCCVYGVDLKLILIRLYTTLLFLYWLVVYWIKYSTSRAYLPVDLYHKQHTKLQGPTCTYLSVIISSYNSFHCGIDGLSNRNINLIYGLSELRGTCARCYTDENIGCISVNRFPCVGYSYSKL